MSAGKYTFTMTGDGDADLYVRVGSAPTTRLYDCRPYKAGSGEACTVNVTSDSTVHVMARGWAATSKFKIVGTKN